MSRLTWYWHRLRAMSPGEVAGHLRKKIRQSTDAKRTTWPAVDLQRPASFPVLPPPELAPASLRAALRGEVTDILAGRWRFFGQIELQVDDPPRWQFDYAAGRSQETSASGLHLNYRTMPAGVDSKYVWEPSRWSQLVRLAMAAHILGDARAADKCLEWLEDWVRCNPPYRGWNWTSALEVGIRLIQFTWIDALLQNFQSANDERRARPGETADRKALPATGGPISERLRSLREAILPAHVWYAWRHRSFGSSANNHLLGELVGGIVATARWPALERCGTSLDELQRRWEHEVLAQFDDDGGNKEQALNYQLFSWEFCWQARLALIAAGRSVDPAVEKRLRAAAQFFVDVQIPSDPWDYGDSDSAYVTPFFSDDRQVVAEWHRWFFAPDSSPALAYWLGTVPLAAEPQRTQPAGRTSWHHLEPSGHATRDVGRLTLRWDLSPLGLGTMAAHGHLDALHLSVWADGVAVVIDPGTGAYHADKPLRNWLASRAAHNGPAPAGEEWPKRLGPFLWAETHGRLRLENSRAGATDQAGAEWITPGSIMRRAIDIESAGTTLTVTDLVNARVAQTAAGQPFVVRWQFAPGTRVETLSPRRFRVHRPGASPASPAANSGQPAEVALEIDVGPAWSNVACVTDPGQVPTVDPGHPLAGTVSPTFRHTLWAPYLKLTASETDPHTRGFTTTFRAL